MTVAGSMLWVAASAPAQPAPSLAIQSTAADGVALTWPSWANAYWLEHAEELGPNLAWSLAPQAPYLSEGQIAVDVSPTNRALFYRLHTRPPSDLPADPRTTASLLDRTVVTDFAAATSFLYSGPGAVQNGVAPGTLNLAQVAVLRGVVKARDETPLPGVSITVLNHPEYGCTLTRADGLFDLAVNGGASLTLNHEKAGHLAAQRQITVPRRDYAWLPDVVLVPLDSAVTTVDLTAGIPMQERQWDRI